MREDAPSDPKASFSTPIGREFLIPDTAFRINASIIGGFWRKNRANYVKNMRRTGGKEGNCKGEKSAYILMSMTQCLPLMQEGMAFGDLIDEGEMKRSVFRGQFEVARIGNCEIDPPKHSHSYHRISDASEI